MEDSNNKYEIISTTNRYNVLTIHDVIDVDADDSLSFEDFDAVFVDMADFMEDRDMLAIRLASPLYSEKCRFKPFFVTKRLKSFLSHTIDVLIDGYATDSTDSSMNQTIAEIYANMRRYNFMLGTEPVNTHAEEIFRLCRYAISRGLLTFSSSPVPAFSSGYMSIYYNTVYNPLHELFQSEERNYFHKQLLNLGYIRYKRYLEKVHTCPHCGRSNLMFMETCTHCGSSNLKEQAVIHHFRCAHVAPVDEFEWDGELRCPKCKRQLMHIGVDYDKPSAVYTCNECKQSFMYPNMKVLCASCRNEHRPSDLKPLDVVEYEFTADGIRAFASNDITTAISQVGFYGHSTMRDFEDYIRLYADSPERTQFLMVIRYHLYDPDILKPRPYDMQPRIVKWMRRLYNYKKALRGNDYYFMYKVSPGEVSARQSESEYELNSEFKDYAQHYSDFVFNLHSTYVLHHGEDAERFIEQIKS